MELNNVLVRLIQVLALLSTGLLAGAFGYGAVNVAPTFAAVPLDVRLVFHAELMKMNGPVIQIAMAVSTFGSLLLASLTRGVPRLLAATAGALTVTSFLVTRFGNVPINGQIKVWAVTSAPPGYTNLLRQWETFNIIRTGTAVVAFVLLLVIVFQQSRRPAVEARWEKAPSLG